MAVGPRRWRHTLHLVPGDHTRYDKLAVSYHTWLVLAAPLLWLPA
jgi:hypothetical protein